MVSKTLCNVIAYLSAILSGIGCVMLIILLTATATVKDEIDTYQAETIKKHDGYLEIIAVIQLLGFIGSFITSVLLIIGIKRDRASFVAPWVFIGAIGIIICIASLCSQPNVQNIVTIVIQIAFWFPIFCFYRELRKNEQEAS
ncbi:uncharacterized protein LOC142241656 [Haematobia irritans]|uniref:uncharacterized protein LOC142241656 n=1 Tax=Haematobia irritans TaxID=7368 RepID=UPI003F5078D8